MKNVFYEYRDTVPLILLQYTHYAAGNPPFPHPYRDPIILRYAAPIGRTGQGG